MAKTIPLAERLARASSSSSSSPESAGGSAPWPLLWSSPSSQGLCSHLTRPALSLGSGEGRGGRPKSEQQGTVLGGCRPGSGAR